MYFVSRVSIKNRTSNERIRKIMSAQLTINDVIRKKQLVWDNRVKQMSHNRIPKITLGSRGRNMRTVENGEAILNAFEKDGTVCIRNVARNLL